MGPFVRSGNKTDKMMKALIVALIPIVLFNEYKNGVIPYINNKTDIIGLCYPLIVVIVGMLTTYLTELIVTKITKQKSYYSYIPGLFIALVLPLNTPIEIFILACVLGIVVGKMLYGGFGNNIFNPALIGCLFVLTAYSSVISSNGGYLNSYEVDTISHATPLSNMSTTIGSYDTLVKPYGDLGDFSLGFIPGAPGETCSVLCLIGLIYLIKKDAIKIKIPLTYISTVFILTLIIGSMNGVGIWYPCFQVLSGGLLFGSIFMATDPVTSPVTGLGQVLYGLCLGLLTVTFRYLTPYPEGVLTSILIMNMLVFILDKIGVRNNNYNKKKIISLLVVLISMIGIVFAINNSFNKNNDENFNIISKTTKNNTTTYIATEKSFRGPIKAEIKIKNKKVISYKVLESNDEYVNRVIKENYLEDLIKDPNIDTISGATKSSTALKQLIINVMKEAGIYEE